MSLYSPGVIPNSFLKAAPKVFDELKPLLFAISGIYSIPLERDRKLRSMYVNGRRAYMTSREMSGRGGFGEYEITAGSLFRNKSWLGMVEYGRLRKIGRARRAVQPDS